QREGRARARAARQRADRHALQRAGPAAEADERDRAGHPLLGVGIDEDTAIVGGDGRFEVVGTGGVTVVDAGQSTVAYAASDDEPMAMFDVSLHLLPAGCAFQMQDRLPEIGDMRGPEEG